MLASQRYLPLWKMAPHFVVGVSTVPDAAVYAAFVERFGLETCPSSSSSATHPKRVWKEHTRDEYLQHMVSYVLRDGNRCGQDLVCTDVLMLGASGVLFMYGRDATCVPEFCVKFIPNRWSAPKGLRRCGCLVTHTARVEGRLQVMEAGEDDLWSFHATMAEARDAATRRPDDGLASRALHVEVMRFRAAARFLVAGVLELVQNDVVMTDVKSENVVVWQRGVGGDEFKFCDIESFSELDGSSVHPSRCTFEPCKGCASMGALTTAFATMCTAIDVANNVVGQHEVVSLASLGLDAARPAEFSLLHPFVVAASRSKNKNMSPFVGGLRALARHRVWGNQVADGVFVLSVLRKVEADMNACWA